MTFESNQYLLGNNKLDAAGQPLKAHEVIEIENRLAEHAANPQGVLAWSAVKGHLQAKGSHVKVYLNGKQSILPMHNTDLKTGTLEGIKKQLGLK